MKSVVSAACVLLFLSRNFRLLPSQLVELVQRGLILRVKDMDLIPDYQSVVSACLHAGTNAICGGDISLRVLGPAHGIANLSGESLGAARDHARNDSQSGAQHNRQWSKLATFANET